MRPFLLSVDSASVPELRPGGPYLRHASRTLVSLLLSLAIRLIYFNSVISMSWIFSDLEDWLRPSPSPEWRITDSNR